MSYGQVLVHPVSRRLYAASTISLLGDWVGVAALVVLAFDLGQDSVVAPAAIFTVQGVAAFVGTSLAGPWLDRLDRRLGVTAGYAGGALALLLPVLVQDSLLALYVAAGVLGALRPITGALRHAVAGNDLPSDLLGPTVALEGATGQLLVAVGLALGGALAVGTSAVTALTFDIATFSVSAVIAIGLPRGRGADAVTRPRWSDGHRVWLGDLATRRLGLLLVSSAFVGALPETLAPLGSALPDDPTNDVWLPFVIAAQASGTALGSLAAGLNRQFEQGAGLIGLTLASAAMLGVGAIAFPVHPAALGMANLLFGFAFTYTITARTAFTRTVDPAQLGAAVASAITLVMLAEAVGSVTLAWIAEVGSPGLAYLVAGALVGASAVAAMVMGAGPSGRAEEHQASRNRRRTGQPRA